MLHGGVNQGKQLCFSDSQTRFPAVFVVQECLVKPHSFDSAKTAENQSDGIEVPTPGEVVKEARLPRIRCGPEAALRPIQDDRAIRYARENVRLDVVLPVGALGVDEEQGAASCSVATPEPDSKNRTPDEQPGHVRDNRNQEERGGEDDENTECKRGDRIEAIYLRSAVLRIRSAARSPGGAGAEPESSQSRIMLPKHLA